MEDMAPLRFALLSGLIGFAVFSCFPRNNGILALNLTVCCYFVNRPSVESAASFFQPRESL